MRFWPIQRLNNRLITVGSVSVFSLGLAVFVGACAGDAQSLTSDVIQSTVSAPPAGAQIENSNVAPITDSSGDQTNVSKGVDSDEKQDEDVVSPHEEAPNATEVDAMNEQFQALLDSVTKANNDDAVSFFQSQCSSCHASSGQYSSFWTADFSGLSADGLRADPMAHVVYQSLVNAIFPAKKPVGMPFKIPIEMGSNLQVRLLSVIKWFIQESPSIPRAAYREFGHINPFGSDVDLSFQFTCKSPVTFRKFLTRFTLDAFGRMPTSRDLGMFSEFKIDEAVTKQGRQAVVDGLLAIPTWRTEFIQYGLNKFARKLSGSDDIRESGLASEQSVLLYDAKGERVKKVGLTNVEANALREEFFQLIFRNIDPDTGKENKKYRELLLGDELFVNQFTGPLYNCSLMVDGDEWKICNISSSSSGFRSSYFTSFSYLASRSSSFLADNNNYSRLSMLYQFIKGSPLQAATDGPKGGAVNPLPACLKSRDTRGHLVGSNFAPIGTIQIPHTGNVCQSCHIDRNLASGSILFRPFGTWGQILTSSAMTTFRDEIPGVTEALKAVRRSVDNPQDQSVTEAVTIEYLASLLPDSSMKAQGESACVLIDGQEVEISNVKGMAEAMIGDGKVLGQGLARHIPRAISNIGNTNTELLETMQAAFDSSGGELLPVFQSYFNSETFACENGLAENGEVQ